MPNDTDLDLACPHMVVQFAPFECKEHGHLVDSWLCEDCEEEFVPAAEAADWREAAHELREGLILLGREHARLRIVSAVGGIFLLGLLVGRR